MSGKGDKRRPETTPGSYSQGYDNIDWSKTREAAGTAPVPQTKTPTDVGSKAPPGDPPRP